MPRRAREKSGSGIYHVILRGSNQQQIFYDAEDNRRFLKTLEKYKNETGFSLYAYCLMGNHIHLLIKEGREPLETLFRKVGASFVFWYNLKYQRSGHLFQDRYRSEPVENDAYFLTALRYILRNPVKAGLCAAPDDYPYSSMKEYLGAEKGITDTDFVYSIITREQLIEYCTANADEPCMDVEETRRKGVTDESAVEIIKKELGALPADFGSMERKKLYESIQRLIHCGVSIRQLSRLTGISKSTIERSLK